MIQRRRREKSEGFWGGCVSFPLFSFSSTYLISYSFGLPIGLSLDEGLRAVGGLGSNLYCIVFAARRYSGFASPWP